MECSGISYLPQGRYIVLFAFGERYIAPRSGISSLVNTIYSLRSYDILTYDMFHTICSPGGERLGYSITSNISPSPVYRQSLMSDEQYLTSSRFTFLSNEK